MQWEPGIDEEFPVEVTVEVEDRRGVLATVATVIGDADSNIENVGIEERDGLTNSLQVPDHGTQSPASRQRHAPGAQHPVGDSHHPHAQLNSNLAHRRKETEKNATECTENLQLCLW